MMIRDETEPALKELIDAGKPPKTIVVAVDLIEKLRTSPQHTLTDSSNVTYTLRDDCYLSVHGGVWKIDFSRIVYQDWLNYQGASFRAVWPD